MLISIITPTYNSVETIVRCYQSICKQTYVDWEWVVTDDCSTDETFETLMALERNDSRVKLLRLDRNSGPGVARNCSIDKARGEFIAFIDSDDTWESGKLERQLAEMLRGYDFSFTAYRQIHKGGSASKEVDAKGPFEVNYDDLLRKKVTLGCSTVMLRRSFVAKKRMPNIRSGQDYAFWLNLLRDGGVARRIPDVLTNYYVLPGSVSRNKVKKARRQWQIYREIEDIPFTQSFICFVSYAWRAVTR